MASVFDGKLVKRINGFRRADAKVYKKEQKLLKEFESRNAKEIEILLDVLLNEAQPKHAQQSKEILEKHKSGELTGKDIVLLHDLLERNRNHFEGK